MSKLDVTDLIGSLYAGLNALREPDTGELVTFRLKRGQHQYRYFQVGQKQFCYTPHPDTSGWFWVFNYEPVGPGSQTGKATHWKLSHPVRYRKARIARMWARSRCLKAMKEKEV